MKIALLFSLLLSACSSVKKVTLPDGTDGLSLKCPAKETCYEKAREACKGNYKILESGNYSAGEGISGYAFTIACENSAK